MYVQVPMWIEYVKSLFYKIRQMHIENIFAFLFRFPTILWYYDTLNSSETDIFNAKSLKSRNGLFYLLKMQKETSKTKGMVIIKNDLKNQIIEKKKKI